MRDRPLAAKDPSLDDYVPVNINTWETSSITIPLLEHHLSDCFDGQLRLDGFGLEAQACYLLSQALDWRRQGIASCNVRAIAAPLQNFLSHLMDPLTGTWGTFCGATSMTIWLVAGY